MLCFVVFGFFHFCENEEIITTRTAQETTTREEGKMRDESVVESENKHQFSALKTTQTSMLLLCVCVCVCVCSLNDEKSTAVSFSVCKNIKI